VIACQISYGEVGRGTRVHLATTVGDAGRRGLEVPPAVAERLVVERGEQEVDRLVGHLPVEGVGVDRVGIVEAADRHPPERQRLDLTGHCAAPKAK
jgi:hypothetical protein